MTILEGETDAHIVHISARHCNHTPRLYFNFLSHGNLLDDQFFVRCKTCNTLALIDYEEQQLGCQNLLNGLNLRVDLERSLRQSHLMVVLSEIYMNLDLENQTEHQMLRTLTTAVSQKAFELDLDLTMESYNHIHLKPYGNVDWEPSQQPMD